MHTAALHKPRDGITPPPEEGVSRSVTVDGGDGSSPGSKKKHQERGEPDQGGLFAGVEDRDHDKFFFKDVSFT